MIKLIDLANVMNGVSVMLFVNDNLQVDVDYGEDMSQFGECIVTEIAHQNCDTIAVYAKKELLQ